MELSDEILIERVVKGRDRHAYSQLVLRYQSRLRQALRQQCAGDHALADDIAQDAFIKAYHALPGFKRQSAFFTWLYQIARNSLMSHYRRNIPEPNSELVERTQAQLTSGGPAMDGRDLNRAMVQLSAPQREALHLTYRLGYSNEEAAQLMKLPLGTIKSHVLRGKTKLKTILHDWQQEVCNERG
ncbi:RNA polymerase sigma factor [Gilvimarinus polysaccharolyticus]|uniref:RNA polymerase sigma factor n=1 Tax=Gilvimarinus polysaccharolyticus TaxID=863921 RepID=UPI000673747A|nr:sigma-70 family RNA polymerase sigma factor [Gilvimarinus polysaccharolyticus]